MNLICPLMTLNPVQTREPTDWGLAQFTVDRIGEKSATWPESS